MYVKDLGRCFEKTGYPLRMTANNDKRGSSSKERNFFIILCDDERENRKNVYNAGKTEFSFHTTHESSKSLSVDRECGMVYASGNVCVCLWNGYHRIMCFLVAPFAVRCNMCDDDTFIEMKIKGRGHEENPGKSFFHNGRNENRKTFTLFLRFVTFFLWLIIVSKVTLFWNYHSRRNLWSFVSVINSKRKLKLL